MKAVKIIVVSICLVFFSTSAFGDSHFYIFGKGNYIKSGGSESDYIEGENDFPIVSAYQNYGAGFGLTFGRGIFIGIEGQYNLSGKATLTDPTDNDTVEINTYRYVSGFVTLGFNIIRSRSVRLYINGGGGICYFLGAEEPETYYSQLDIETSIEPPEKKYPFAGFGGVGLELYLSRSTGLLLCGRYLYIDQEGTQPVYMGMAGIVYRF